MCSIDDETLKKLEKIKKDMQEPEHVEAVDRKIKILKGNKPNQDRMNLIRK